MIDGLTVLGLITARGGSRGVPRKNVRMVAGRPLIGWTIEAAQQSRVLDRLLELRSLLNDATVAYAMPADRSTDIDTEDDLEIAERRLRSIHGVADPNAAPPRA